LCAKTNEVGFVAMNGEAVKSNEYIPENEKEGE
jgi:hypothetical protein